LAETWDHSPNRRKNQLFTTCVSITQLTSMTVSSSRCNGGSGTKLRVSGRGETVSQDPTATMIRDVTISGESAPFPLCQST